MNNSIKLLVPEKDEGKRLDIFLSNNVNHLTRSNIKKIINSKHVTINKKSQFFHRKKLKIMTWLSLK